MFDNVVVGVDEYEHARDAVELAKELGSDGAKITLLYVEVLQERPFPEAEPRSDKPGDACGLVTSRARCSTIHLVLSPWRRTATPRMDTV